MKTLIVIREQDYAWLRHYFPGVHPLLVPICNKPFIEFLIDFSVLAGCRMIRLASDGRLSEVEAYCESGSRWGVQFSYANMLQSDDMQTVLEKNRRFDSDERLMIISGLVFIRYARQLEFKTLFSSLGAGILLICGNGTLSLTGTPEVTGEAVAPLPCSLVALDSIKGYYRLCSEILIDDSPPYVLPGYGSEPDCHIGRNVVISKSAEIRKPVMIGNNVQILQDAVIGPEAIIGSNVIIDRGSTVSFSIVHDNTYIGEHLDVKNRIAAGSILIDPESDSSITMEDPHLLSGIQKNATPAPLLHYLMHAIAAALLIGLQCIPYLLLVPFLKLQKKWMTNKISCYKGLTGKTVMLTATEIERSGTLGRLASALSLDRFRMLFRVLAGQLALIGSRPVISVPQSEPQRSISALYSPAVFSYAEAEDWPVNGGDTVIVERYYLAHGNVFQDLAMTVKALFNRIHAKESV